MTEQHPSIRVAITAETEAARTAILAERMLSIGATGTARAYAEMAAALRARAAHARARITRGAIG